MSFRSASGGEKPLPPCIMNYAWWTKHVVKFPRYRVGMTWEGILE
jgi:hypothetical protein